LSQLRIRQGQSSLSDEEHLALHQSKTLVDGDLSEQQIKKGVPLSVDLSGVGENCLVGYRAKRHSAVIDVDKKAACDIGDFWDPVYASKEKQLILDPGKWCPTTPWLASSVFIMPVFSILDSVRLKPMALVPERCWKSVVSMYLLFWKTGKISAVWCMSECYVTT